MGHGARRVRGHGDGHHGDGVEAGGGQGHVPQPQGAQPADRDADRGADGQLQGDLRDQDVPVLDRSGRGERDDQDDDGSVVEAGLGLQDAGDPGRQGDPAQHGEDGRRVGRGDDRADDEGLTPVQTDEVVRRRGGDAHADADADGRDDGGRRQNRSDLFPLRSEPALGQDDDQGGVADHLRQLGVVELDVEDAVLSEGDADAEVQEQAGESAARGDPYGRHGDEQHERADEQEFVERVDSQGQVPSLRAPAGSSSGSQVLRYLT